jgi:hypothetical protein
MINDIIKKLVEDGLQVYLIVIDGQPAVKEEANPPLRKSKTKFPSNKQRIVQKTKKVNHHTVKKIKGKNQPGAVKTLFVKAPCLVKSWPSRTGLFLF